MTDTANEIDTDICWTERVVEAAARRWSPGVSTWG